MVSNLYGLYFKSPSDHRKKLANRLETRRNHNANDHNSHKHKKSKHHKETEDRGPTSMYLTLNLCSAIRNIPALLESLNIGLRKSNTRVTFKPLQCWAPHSRKMLCAVQSGLCTEGVKQLLLHQLKDMEKKLCRHGKLDTLKWYDKPFLKLSSLFTT